MSSSANEDLLTFRARGRDLSSLRFCKTNDDRKKLRSILDELINLDYMVKFVDVDDSERVLSHCCRLVPLSEQFLVTKLCQLIVKITFRQKVTLTTRGYETVMRYLLEAMKSAHPCLFVDVLTALGSLLYQNGSRSERFNSVLLGEEGHLLEFALSSDNEDVRRAALQCLENMCMRGADGSVMAEESLRICCDTFINGLYSVNDENLSELGRCRIVTAALRGLSHAMSCQKFIVQDRLGEVLGVIKAYMSFYGEPVTASPLFATMVSQQEAKPASSRPPLSKPEESKTRNKKKKKKKKEESRKDSDDEEQIPDLKINSTPSFPVDTLDFDISLTPSWRLNSDSEVSDPDGGVSSKLRSYRAKTRISALTCLVYLAKNSEKRLVFGYWTHFLPGTSTSNTPSDNLVTCILKDRNDKCRLAALSALSSLLDGSKQFLMAAEEIDQTKTSFTAYSGTLGNIVKELHVNLLHALISEQMYQIITHIIKCLAVLVEHTNYQKLKPGLLTRVVKQVRPFLTHRDANIRVSCLTCMGAVLSVQAPLMEVSYILDSYSSSHAGSVGDVTPELRRDAPRFSLPPSPLNRTPYRSQSGFMTPTENVTCTNWLLDRCLRNINQKSTQPESERVLEPLPVRLESLQVLTRLVQGYFACVKNDFSVLQDVVIQCLLDDEPPVQLHGTKLLEVLGNVMRLRPSAAIPNPPSLVSSQDAVQFWISVLSGPLSNLLQKCTMNILRAGGCDCLSTIGADMFSQFPMHLRVLCITLLLGFTSDTDAVTRSSAVRTLGVYVMYECLRDDVSFVADVANTVLVLLEDSSMFVRVKSAWSLANVSEAMSVNKELNNEEFMMDFSDMLLVKMLEGTLKSSRDVDKVRTHTVRALGNLLRYITLKPMEKPKMNDLIDEAIQTMIKYVGTGVMKIRWNACYALGSVLKNESLPIGKAAWTPALFSCLCIALRDCKNFKVRINAAVALNQLHSRHQLGDSDQIRSVWSSLIKSLQSLETITDFSDLKLRDRLPAQVCATLIHLTQFLDVDDLFLISQIVSSNQLLLTDAMLKYWTRLADEPLPIQTLERARGHLAELESVCTDAYCLITIQNLTAIFSHPEVELPSGQVEDDNVAGLPWMMTASLSAFKDTYD